jgi:hypothetical protein
VKLKFRSGLSEKKQKRLWNVVERVGGRGTVTLKKNKKIYCIYMVDGKRV